MAGEAHRFKITVKGVDFFKATAGRPLSEAQLEELDREREHLHIVADAVELDLYRWFNETDEHKPFPHGTLINYMRIYD